MARAIIFGCGYVGSALARRLASDGHDVFAVRRRDEPVTGARLVRADVNEPERLGALPDAVDYAFYTVAADTSSEEDYRNAYVEGLSNVIRVLRGAPPKRLIVTTSTAVYGQDGGEWVDEDSDTRPSRFQGRVLLESEALALNSGLATVIVRLGGIYGPDRTRLIWQVRRGEASLPPSPSYTNRIHRDDCAGVLRHLMTIADPATRYVAVDRDPADLREVITWLASRFGAPPPEDARTRESQDRDAARGKRCRSDRLVASGYRFEYPTFREGYGELIDRLNET